MKQVKLCAKLAMIPFGRFFQAGEIRLQTFSSAQQVPKMRWSMALRESPPIGAGHFHQLKGFNTPRRQHVRPATEIDKIALTVKRNHRF